MMGENCVHLFDECIDLVQQYGRYLLHDPNNHRKSDFEEVSSALMDFCDARTRYLTAQNIFADYSREIEGLDKRDGDMAERFKYDVENTISKLPLGDNSKAYLEFKKSFWRDKNPLDDSEIATVSEAIITIDPITKLTLTDPVKNVKCGHVYEKSSILHFINQKKAVKCPIPGCVAADCVNKDDLIPDVALKRYLEQNKQT